MAKKRRKHEEEDEEFHLPEFDEEKFLRKEVTGAKVMFVVVLLALLAAAISYFLTMAGVVIVAFFAGLSLILLVRYLVPAAGINTSGFEKKDWLGQATTYFFTWLAIWVIMMNVPFADVTRPSLTVYVNGHLVSTGVDEEVNQDWANVTAVATDNAGIMDVVISINGVAPVQMTHSDGGIWFTNITGIVHNTTKGVVVTVTDVSGNPPVSVQVVIARR